MGSVNNPNPWAPYESYKDCSQGICSIYCTQWCYVVFPPPPPELSDDDSGTTFSPLIIAIIGILASAFLLVSYYTIVTRYCRRRNDRQTSLDFEANRAEVTPEQWQVESTGLDETLIKSIAVCKFKKGEGLVEGTECAVCLSEFQEDESLRLLPKCSHAFHLPCIDTWLKSHPNCPLCRCSVVPTSPPPPPAVSTTQNTSVLNVSSLEIRRQNDLILVVDDPERNHHEEVVLNILSDVPPKNRIRSDIDARDSGTRTNESGFDEECTKQIRRSISLGTFSRQHQLLVADILNIKEDDEDLQLEIRRSLTGIGSSEECTLEEEEEQSNRNDRGRDCEVVRNLVSIRRSISTGRFAPTRYDKGKNTIFPN